MIEKPFYKISIKASTCFFDVQVNNVSLLSMDINGRLPITVPLNYLILESGLQELSVRIMPNVGNTTINKEAKFSFILQLFDVENNFERIKDVASYELDQDMLKSGLPVMEHKIKFNADMPYKLSAWQNSIDLKTIQNIRERVEVFCKKIDSLISTKQYDEFIRLMSEREKNMAISMYLSDAASKTRMNDLVKDFEDGFKMQPLSVDDFLIYYADNKVVRIVKKDMDSAIRFFNKETEEEMTLDFLFHLQPGKTELSII
jgi:hypothetical protein